MSTAATQGAAMPSSAPQKPPVAPLHRLLVGLAPAPCELQVAHGEADFVRVLVFDLARPELRAFMTEGVARLAMVDKHVVFRLVQRESQTGLKPAVAQYSRAKGWMPASEH